MEGTFELLGPLDLLQLIARGGRQGSFQVISQNGKGQVFLHGPLVSHAYWGVLEGEEGLMEILTLRQGRFRFVQGAESEKRTIDKRLDYYLFRAVRQLDDRVEVGPFDLVGLSSNSSIGHLTLSPKELSLFTHLSKKISALELSAKSGQPLHKVLTILGHLARLGSVELERRAPRTAKLTLSIQDDLPPFAHVDALLIRAWLSHFGRFDSVYLRSNGRTLTLGVRATENLGDKLMLSTEQLILHGLTAGEELLVWPALPGSQP